LPARIRSTASALVILMLAQIYLGALVAGLRAGYAYNTWPLIDGALVPDAARLFFDTPLWRNFFENILTVQFDHRMLAYVIFIVALLHAVDVARTAKNPSVRAGASVVFAAVMLQVLLGIATLLFVVPLPLAALHQAMAMLVLTAAIVHAAFVIPGPSQRVRLEVAGPMVNSTRSPESIITDGAELLLKRNN
jgi:cytochrome c oxidase assembly protein subunit 15